MRGDGTSSGPGGVRPGRARHRLRTAGAAVAVAALAAGVVGCGTGESDTAEPRLVTVVGKGEVTGSSDTMSIVVSVTHTAADVSAALAETNRTATAVTDAAKAAGVAQADIETTDISINPRYERNAIIDYQATNTVRLRVRDLTKASKVIGDVSRAGGNAARIGQVSFALEDDAELLKRARDAAFADGKAKAEQFASLSGATLGVIHTITEAGAAPRTATPYAADESVRAVPVNPPQQKLTYTVTLAWKLD